MADPTQGDPRSGQTFCTIGSIFGKKRYKSPDLRAYMPLRWSDRYMTTRPIYRSPSGMCVRTPVLRRTRPLGYVCEWLCVFRCEGWRTERIDHGFATCEESSVGVPVSASRHRNAGSAPCAEGQPHVMSTTTPNHSLVRTLRRYAARARQLSRYMTAIHPKGRPGLTIVEVLVVISILGLLLAILLPAVNSARESARRIQCANNRRQIALAVASFHGANGQLPSLYNGELFKGPIPRPMHFHAHSWKTSILPFLEEQPLYESIDFKTRATDPKNAHAVNTRIQTFVCPSTPNTDGLVRYINDPSTPTPIGTAARSDYVATAAVRWQKQIDSDFDPRLWHPSAWGEPRPDDTATVVTYGTRKISFSAIRDGLSHTTLVAESAGRPDRYENGNSSSDLTRIYR